MCRSGDVSWTGQRRSTPHKQQRTAGSTLPRCTLPPWRRLGVHLGGRSRAALPAKQRHWGQTSCGRAPATSAAAGAAAAATAGGGQSAANAFEKCGFPAVQLLLSRGPGPRARQPPRPSCSAGKEGLCKCNGADARACMHVRLPNTRHRARWFCTVCIRGVRQGPIRTQTLAVAVRRCWCRIARWTPHPVVLSLGELKPWQLRGHPRQQPPYTLQWLTRELLCRTAQGSPLPAARPAA